MRHPLHAVLAAIGATAVLVGTGVWLTDEPAPAPPPAYEPTLLEDVDTSTIAITRGPFCDLLAEEPVTEVLGGEVSDRTVWVDGDELPGVGVVHEYGCQLRTEDGPEARAWVLAPPVTPARGRELAEAATAESNCEARGDAPAYGAPSVALVCEGPNRTFASYRGLFGDAWLSCTLALPNSEPRQALLERAGTWCVAVAEAART
ncbi:hypothetical protein KUV85_00775 [Nocardioides panacisoli]|uniref:hypothetical protein n=1 Tax=Nocardioides panacisoli TaxID=627624 RepID=UPI001C62F9F8|nr:hypothetical protein [Nocardioides panacisoli]QYJ04248.1 hypothetical protein KUV85_00775 [Nocardioides panacisoli]